MVSGLVASPAQARKYRFSQKAKDSAEDVTTSVPVGNEVCFSPDEPCDVKLYKLIQSAQKSIDVAVYDINHVKVVHELLAASKRIPVRFIVDKRQAKGQHSMVDALMSADANLRFGKQRGIMHNKFMIIDGRIVETGSFNFTHHASKANQENQVYLTDPAIIKRYQGRFEEMWTNAYGKDTFDDEVKVKLRRPARK
jgi:phosphatidylserine/phosphatidylglycerophosphate/cardiolipin synthase-like enzyme